MTDNVYPYYDNAVQALGATLTDANGSYAEAVLYDKLRQQLPSDWSFIWGTQLGAHEYDFLVLVPGEGIVNIECKGHGYKPLPTNKFQWCNRETGVLEVKDVIGQAAAARKYYVRYLQHALFGEGVVWGVMSYCVVFPLDEFEGIPFTSLPIYRQSDCDPAKLGLEQIVRNSLRLARDLIRNRFGILNPVRLSVDDAQRVWDFWMASVTSDCSEKAARRIKISLDDYRQRMEGILTVSQSAVMGMILESSSRHFLVEGTAGTGKTVLALASAAQLRGRNLFVCFNKVLGCYLRHLVPEGGNVLVSHFHRLDEFLFGRRFSLPEDSSETASDYWRRYDELLLSEARNLLPGGYECFDNIIVDEAQDLTVVQLRFLLRFCKTGGRVLFFSDMEQTLYRNRIDVPTLKKFFPDLSVHSLAVNLRNTKHVDSYCKALFPDDVALARTRAVLVGPQVYHRKVRKDALNGFLHDEVLSQFNPSEVAVLSPYHDLLASVTSASGTTFVGPDEKSLTKTEKNMDLWFAEKAAWKSTTSSFKGLEAMVTVHLVPQGYGNETFLYVGGSRASYALFVVEVEL